MTPRRRRSWIRAAALMAGAVVLAVCGEATGDPELRARSLRSPRGGGADRPGAERPDGSCPFTAAELAGVVGGSWREVDSSIDDLWASETEHPSVVCHYEAERDDAEMYVTTVKVIASDAEEARSSTAAAAC